MTTTSAANFYDNYWDYRVERGDTSADNRVKLRHEQTRDFLQTRFEKLQSVNVLDMGCGDGVLGQLLDKHGYTITGCDVAQRAVELAKPHYSNITQFDLDKDETPRDWVQAFDAVVCLEVLEHIEKPEMNIKRAFEMTKCGGVAIFSFPNIFSWKNRLSFMSGRWPTGYTTYDPREHLHVFELAQFKAWVVNAGFTLVGTAITPDLPSWKPLRKAMFAMRNSLNRFCPSLWAMQINVFAEKPQAS